MRAVPRSRYFIFALLAFVGCTGDLLSKHHMFAWLKQPDDPRSQPHWIVQNFFGLQTSLNEGALFGMGQGKVVLFSMLSIAAALGILWWLILGGAARDRWLTLALGGIMGGILGNLYDRLGLPGLRWLFAAPGHAAGDPIYAVRDWILVRFGAWDWPNFNIADSLLVCGAAMLFLHAFFVKPKSEQTAPAEAKAA